MLNGKKSLNIFFTFRDCKNDAYNEQRLRTAIDEKEKQGTIVIYWEDILQEGTKYQQNKLQELETIQNQKNKLQEFLNDDSNLDDQIRISSTDIKISNETSVKLMGSGLWIMTEGVIIKAKLPIKIDMQIRKIKNEAERPTMTKGEIKNLFTKMVQEEVVRLEDVLQGTKIYTGIETNVLKKLIRDGMQDIDQSKFDITKANFIFNGHHNKKVSDEITKELKTDSFTNVIFNKNSLDYSETKYITISAIPENLLTIIANTLNAEFKQNKIYLTNCYSATVSQNEPTKTKLNINELPNKNVDNNGPLGNLLKNIENNPNGFQNTKSVTGSNGPIQNDGNIKGESSSNACTKVYTQNNKDSKNQNQQI